MSAFVDSSGLLKLYVPERGSDWMSNIARSQPVAISSVAITEIGSALSRKVRDGDLTPTIARDAWKAFRRETRSFIVVPVSQRLLVRAANLTARLTSGLRTLDALQLQAALEARENARAAELDDPLFIASDRRLLEAAQFFGFVTDNPLDHP
jgi:uncharacterized protein